MPASRRFPRKILLAAALLAGLAGFGYATWRETLPFPDNLAFAEVEIRKVQVVDRHREPLTITYQNDWNLHDWRDLHQIPQRLQQIFLLAEDRRFYRHPGVDWWARAHALSQNLLAGRIVRGASTITEQSVRMLHPRPRTFWSRWVETFEAMELEARFSKAAILEFYLNQVPYAHQRRGVVQAARHYFDRDLETLNLKEMMALAVLVRSPSRLDLRRGQVEIQQPVARLAERMRQLGLLDEDEYRAVLDEPLHLRESRLPVRAVHFVNHVYQSYQTVPRTGRLHTTLDSALQGQAQAILDQRVRDLRGRGVRNGAALVVDHLGGEILAWVNSGDFFADLPGSQIDAVSVPRQPGSTLKPFVYALALEKGWTAATLIDDTPLAEAVGSGLHSYRNYSRGHYGLLRLRFSGQ
jgi:penicillin-binding protein 1C